MVDPSKGENFLTMPIHASDISPKEDSLLIVDDASRAIIGMFGKLPEDIAESDQMFHKVCSYVYDMRNTSPYSDSDKLSEYLDLCAVANYLCNMTLSGEPGFAFRYDATPVASL